jgi:hypothetical protein
MVACHLNFQFQVLDLLKGTKEFGVDNFIVHAFGKAMTNYKGLKHQYEFLKLKNIPKKHWSDASIWEIIKHLHN